MTMLVKSQIFISWDSRFK